MAPAPRSSFIGHDADLAAVGSAMARSPLVTLTGPPGVGKTRLALEVAAQQESSFTDGIATVALGTTETDGAALAAIGRELMGTTARRPSVSQLATHVGGRSLLLILDDLDAVVGVGAAVAELVTACPGLRVLATSRERLRVSVEQEYPVPPLATPTAEDALDPGRLRAVPAVRLLAERAAAVAPEFRIEPDNAVAVASLCRGLDGLPLAYELIAPQLKAFSAQELTERLGDRLALAAVGPRDAPERHRTLRTAIGWSYDLLPPPAKALFRRASVFAGPWTARDLAAVCLGPRDGAYDVHELLLALVDRSLVRPVTRGDGETSYMMLDSLAAFAAEALAASEDATATRARHTTHFAALARLAEGAVGTQAEVASLDTVHAQVPDLAAAGNHAIVAGDLESAAWLAATCGWAGYLAGAPEGDLMPKVLAADLNGISPSAGAALQAAAGVTEYDAERLTDAQRHLETAARGSSATGDQRREAIARAFLGHVARRSGRWDEAATHYRAAGDYFASVGNSHGTAWNSHDLGLLARDAGRPEEAVTRLRRALDDFRDIGYPWAAACTALPLGRLLAEGGEAEEGGDLLLEALDLFREWGDSRGMAACVRAAARLAAIRSDHATAARLLGASAGLHQPPDAESGSSRELRETVRRALGDQRANRLRADGRALPIHEVLTVAKQALSSPVLSERERQIAAALAGGATNRQAGRSLGITERTVETHVSHIMTKLGVRSRAEIAAWATRHGVGP